MNTQEPLPDVGKMDISKPNSRENTTVQRPRGSRQGSRGKGKPTNRTTSWRSATNQRVVAQLDAERDARFAKFSTFTKTASNIPASSDNNELQAVQFLGMAVTTYAHPVPITTQGLGFLVNQYYLKLIQQLGAERLQQICTMYQLYRYSLAQLTYHLYRTRIEIVPRYTYRTELPQPPAVRYDFLEAMKTCELNAGFITSYIQRIGVVVAGDIPHVPILMIEGQSPLHTNIFNLRRALEVIDARDDASLEFLDNNSIPGLRINANGRVVNMNEVMPLNYARENLFDDANAVRALMNFVTSKMRDMQIYTGHLGLISEGNAGMLLVSNTSPGENIRIPPMINGCFPPIIGTVDSFWSMQAMTDDQRRLGVLGLYCRHATGLAYVPHGNLFLTPDIAHYMISADYRAYLSRLVS